ncbi:MAG TPA: hypothetical protein VN541_16060 [Tepidisphaeraceae bacterium]|nr:hypothetical protein [Tepidisphaeraceae bacterium]
MRTLTDATLYTVNGPMGTYFAVRNHETGCIHTEQTKSAAAKIANEQDLLIVDTGEIDHSELLKMMGKQGQDFVAPGHRLEMEPVGAPFTPPGMEFGDFDRPVVWREPEAPAHR